jgi:hypothetical protein
MKCKILSSTSVLALCFSIAPIAQAQTPSPTKPVAIILPNITSKAVEANAFDLTSLARNGYLQGQGIPSDRQLSWEFETGRITAEDIVKAGVQANRVSPEALNDQAYIRAIEYNLTEPPISNE